MIIRLGVDYKSAVYKTSQQCYGLIVLRASGLKATSSEA